MSTELDTDPTEVMLRATFAAAADHIEPGAAPALPVDPIQRLTDASDRRPAARWIAAAALIALIAGAATWWTGERRTASVDVSGDLTPESSSLRPFLEPTWVPEGMALITAGQDDRPPQYLADVIAPDGGHATVHWTTSPVWDVPSMRDPRFDQANTRFAGDDRRPDLRVWAEATEPAPRMFAATPADEHPAPTATFIAALVMDRVRSCDRTGCPPYSPSASDSTLRGTTMVRQGPDEPNTGQTALRYTTADGVGSFTVVTYASSRVLPPSTGHALPAPGLTPAFDDDPEGSSQRGTLTGGQPVMELGGQIGNVLIAEFPEASMSVVITSAPNWSETSIPGDGPAFPGLTGTELTRIAESLVVREPTDFAVLSTQLHDDLAGPALSTVNGDEWMVEFGDYTGARAVDSTCLLTASLRLPGPRWLAVAGETCPRPGETPTPEPVAVSGVVALDHGRRAWLGIYDDSVATVRFTFDDGSTTDAPSVTVDGRTERVVAVEIPPNAGSVELLDTDGTAVASASTNRFSARLDGSLWFPPGRS